MGGVFAFVIFMAHIEIKDLDLWLHLAMGKFIAQNGYVPQEDVLSCTISGRPWVNHEWLFQVIVYQIFERWGVDGLTAMQVLIVTVTFVVLLFLGYDREKQLNSIILLLVAALASWDRFIYRPDLFSQFFIVLYIYLLLKHRNKGWLPLVLFFLQILWVNTHGFFIWGIIIVLAPLLGEWFTRFRTTARNRDEYARLKRSLVLVIIACLLNPMGLQGFLYPLKVLTGVLGESKIFFNRIGELEAPLSWGNLFSLDDYVAYKLLILWSGLAMGVNYRCMKVGDFLLWVLFLFFSLSAKRNVVFFAFIAYWIIGLYGENLKSPFKFIFAGFTPTFKLILFSLVKILIVVFLITKGEQISYHGYFDFDTYERKSEFGGICLRNFPYRAADFLVAHNIKGNFLNDFNSGAYLLGRCFPNIKVSIDGRTELYGVEFFKEYDEIWKGNQDLFREWVKRYNLTGIMFGSVFGPIPESFLEYVSKLKDWVLVYFDYDGVIFLKDNAANQKIITQYAIDIKKWQVPKSDIHRIGLRHVEPYQHANRAFSLASMQQYDRALEEGFEAIRILPNYQKAYKILGYCFLKKGNLEEAFRTLRVAKLFDPSDKEVRYNLAAVYEQKNDFEKAIQQAEIVRRDPAGETLALFLLSRVYARTNQFDLSLKSLRSVGKIIPAHASDIQQIGDIIYDKGQYPYALETYRVALKTQRNLAQFHYRMGLCYVAMQKPMLAKEEFEKVLSIDPNHDETKKKLEEMATSL